MALTGNRQDFYKYSDQVGRYFGIWNPLHPHENRFNVRWYALLIIVFSLSIILYGQSLYAQDLAKGDVKFISCHNLPVHNSPSGFSNVLNHLAYGTKVTVLEIETVAKGNTPLWIKVKSENNIVGYVHVSCLISERLMKKQNEGRGTVKEEDAKASVRHFSESEEKVDLYAMKGAGGSAKTGQADYTKLNAILQNPSEKNPQTQYRDFRAEGKLAEFKSESVFALQNETVGKTSDHGVTDNAPETQQSHVTEPDKVKEIASDSSQETMHKPVESRSSSELRMYPLTKDEIYQLLKAYRNKNPGRCLEFCSWALEIDPSYAAIYNERGYAYVSLGNYSVACDSFQRAASFGDAFGIHWAKSKGLCK